MPCGSILCLAPELVLAIRCISHGPKVGVVSILVIIIVHRFIYTLVIHRFVHIIDIVVSHLIIYILGERYGGGGGLEE